MFSFLWQGVPVVRLLGQKVSLFYFSGDAARLLSEKILTILFHQSSMTAPPLSPHQQQLVLMGVLTQVFSVRLESDTTVLFCFSLTTSEVEHLFIYLMTTWIYTSVNCLFISFVTSGFFSVNL